MPSTRNTVRITSNGMPMKQKKLRFHSFLIDDFWSKLALILFFDIDFPITVDFFKRYWIFVIV